MYWEILDKFDTRMLSLVQINIEYCEFSLCNIFELKIS